MKLKEINKNKNYCIQDIDCFRWVSWWEINIDVFKQIKNINIIKKDETYSDRPIYFISSEDYNKVLNILNLK